MTDKPTDYTTMEPPDEKPPTELSTHERRADILQVLIEAGEPSAVTQRHLADKYDVHESTVSRDMDRLRESINTHLGTDAKFTTRTLYQHVVRELLAVDDWRATKAAWDVAQEWNEWLAEIGEQHREPDRSEVNVDMRATGDVAYEIVRGSDPETESHVDANPDTDVDTDHEALGFTTGPQGTDTQRKALTETETETETVKDIDDD